MNHRPVIEDERPVLGPLTLAVGGVAKALTQDCWAMAEPTLGAAFAVVDELQRDLDRLAAAVLAEVQVRGVADTCGGGGGRGRGGRRGSRSSLGSALTDWTRFYAPAMPERHRYQLVRVASALADDQGAARVGSPSGGSPDRPTLEAFSTGVVRLGGVKSSV